MILRTFNLMRITGIKMLLCQPPNFIKRIAENLLFLEESNKKVFEKYFGAPVEYPTSEEVEACTLSFDDIIARAVEQDSEERSGDDTHSSEAACTDDDDGGEPPVGRCAAKAERAASNSRADLGGRRARGAAGGAGARIRRRAGPGRGGADPWAGYGGHGTPQACGARTAAAEAGGFDALRHR